MGQQRVTRSASKQPARSLPLRIASLVLAPACTIGLIELVLWLAGIGNPTEFFLEKTINGAKYVVQNDRFGWRFFGRRLARTPQSCIFARPKPPNTIRIFVLGESAAYGDPQPAYGLPRVLQALLSSRHPQIRFEVVNAAMTAINSHVIVDIARDCAKQAGDFWVVYMGNNELIGPFGPGTVFGARSLPLWLIRLNLWLRKIRTGQLLSHLSEQLGSKGGLQEWGGLAMFTKSHIRHDDRRVKGVYRHFRKNLQEILRTGCKAGAKVVVSTVATNLADCGPFGSGHRPDLTGPELAGWQQLYEAAERLRQAGDLSRATDLYMAAARIDPTFADLQYRLGQCYLALGQIEDARQCLQNARDYDTLRFRADTQLNAIIRQVCMELQDSGVWLVDGQKELSDHSPFGLPGKELFYEHVHLRFKGNYLLALAIARQIDQLLPVQENDVQPWLDLDGCARLLAITDWDLYQALTSMVARLTDRPFTDQCDHTQQVQYIRAQIQQIVPQIGPGGLAMADQVYREAIQRRADDWVLYANHAFLLVRLGQTDKAVHCWQQVHRLLPHVTEPLCQIGALLVAQGRYADAVESYQKALRLDRQDIVAMDGLATALANSGRYQEAIRLYQKVLRIKPAYSQSRMGLALALKAIGKTQQAQKELRFASDHPLNTPTGLLATGKACIDQGWYEKAVQHLTKAADLAPADPAIRLYLGLALSRSGQQDKAIQEYANAVSLDPELPEAHFQLGLALGRQGNHAQAMEHFAQAVRLAPNLLEARLNLATALLRLGRRQEALEQYRHVLRQDPSNQAALRQIQAIESASSNYDDRR